MMISFYTGIIIQMCAIHVYIYIRYNHACAHHYNYYTCISIIYIYKAQCASSAAS